MRWDPGHSSPDLIDRRGEGRGGIGGFGLLGLLPFLIRTPGGWVVLLVVAALSIFGGRFAACGGGTTAEAPHAAGGGPRSGEERVQFVGFVLDDAQNTWTKIFDAEGMKYQRAKLVLFTDATRTACGYGESATGPFYCPLDQRVYLDLSFFRELDRRLGAEGDFAQAYVIAHEIGHHVQRQIGTMDRRKGSAKGEDSGSVRVELQADCFAGIWAHATKERKLLESGDLEEALGAAAAIGDDRLQKQSTGRVSPESFTHGTSAQRARWFRRGYENGRMEDCDTFSATEL